MVISFEDKPASFFKIFFSEFSSKLGIPPEFVKKHGGTLPQISLLETESGKNSWDIKIKYINEHFYLTDGWSQFVKDNRLIEKNFLLFRLVSKSTFQVAIYGVDGCPKEPSSPISPNPQSSGSEDVVLLSEREFKEENYESGGEMSGIKTFSAVIKSHSRFAMNIPKTFARETGIARKREIKLQNLEGKVWAVGINVKKDGRGVRMTRGWSEFRQENNLVVGSKCWFEFDATSQNLFVKKEREIIKINSAKRGRGRPHKSLAIC